MPSLPSCFRRLFSSLDVLLPVLNTLKGLNRLWTPIWTAIQAAVHPCQPPRLRRALHSTLQVATAIAADSAMLLALSNHLGFQLRLLQCDGPSNHRRTSSDSISAFAYTKVLSGSSPCYHSFDSVGSGHLRELRQGPRSERQRKLWRGARGERRGVARAPKLLSRSSLFALLQLDYKRTQTEESGRRYSSANHSESQFAAGFRL